MQIQMEIADDWILLSSSQHCTRTHCVVSSWISGKKCIPMLSHVPYSPDLSPCDFYLFPKLKSKVKACHFQTLDSIQKAVTNAFKTLTEGGFQSYYETLKIRWAKCVASEGMLF
jgi:hypothetical protein